MLSPALSRLLYPKQPTRIEAADKPSARGLHQEQIVAWGKAELVPLRAKLFQALLNRKVNTKEVESILAEFHDVYAKIALLAKISGFISPWLPEVYEMPSGPIPKAIDAIRTLSIRYLETEWDALTAASKWLSRQISDWPDKLAGIVDSSQVSAAAFGVEVDTRMLERLNRELQDSFDAGEGRDAWRERLKGIIDTRARFDETIARTAMKRAFQAGKDEVLHDPVIADVFPYRQYFATMDNRVRPEHAAMNRKVYHQDSELGRKAEQLLIEWGCRCNDSPLTEADALARGVSAGGEPPGGLTAARARRKREGSAA